MRKRQSTFNRDNFYNLTEVSELGFTKGMIKQLLGNCDLEKPVKYYGMNTTSKLWSKERVEAVMATGEFAAALGKAEKRRLAAKKASETKRARTDELLRKYIEGIRVEKLTDMPYEGLLELGVQHRNYRAGLSGGCFFGEPARQVEASEVDEWTKRRWAVNYIRHALSNYDDRDDGLPGLVRETSGMVGCKEMYFAYKSAVLDAIAEAYPKLKGECLNQKRKDDLSEYEEFQRMADEMFGIRHVKKPA